MPPAMPPPSRPLHQLHAAPAPACRNLDFNSLSGSIGSFASEELTLLKLSSNQFSGSLPADVVATFRPGMKPMIFSAQRNQLSGPVPNFPCLGDACRQQRFTVLRLNDNQLSGVVPASATAQASHICDLKNNACLDFSALLAAEPSLARCSASNTERPCCIGHRDDAAPERTNLNTNHGCAETAPQASARRGLLTSSDYFSAADLLAFTGAGPNAPDADYQFNVIDGHNQGEFDQALDDYFNTYAEETASVLQTCSATKAGRRLSHAVYNLAGSGANISPPPSPPPPPPQQQSGGGGGSGPSTCDVKAPYIRDLLVTANASVFNSNISINGISASEHANNHITTLDGKNTQACQDYQAVCAYKKCEMATVNCANDAGDFCDTADCADTTLHAGFTVAQKCGVKCGTCPSVSGPAVFSRINAVLDFCNQINSEHCFQSASVAANAAPAPGSPEAAGCTNATEMQVVMAQLSAANVTCGSPPDGLVKNATGSFVHVSNVTVTAPECCATLSAPGGFCKTIEASSSECMRQEAMVWCNAHAYDANPGCSYYDHEEKAFGDIARQADCIKAAGSFNGGVTEADLDCDGDMDMVTADKAGHFIVHRCDSTGSGPCTYVRDTTGAFANLTAKTFTPAVKVNNLKFLAGGDMQLVTVESTAGQAKTKTTTFANSATLTTACTDKGSLFPATGPVFAAGVSSRRRLEEADLVAEMAVAITAFVGSDSSPGLNPSAWSEKFGTGMFLDASPNSKTQPWRTVAAAGPMVTLMNTVQTYLNKLYCNFPDDPQPQAFDSTATGSLAYAHNFSNDFLFKLANLTYADPSTGCQCVLSDDGQWVPTAPRCAVRSAQPKP